MGTAPPRPTKHWFWLIAFIAGLAVLRLLFPPPSVTTNPAADQAALAQLRTVSSEAPVSLTVEPAAGVTPVVDQINHAHHSIDLVIYELEDPTVETALAAARQRGVAVRVLLNRTSGFGQYPNDAAVQFLQAHHVPVRWASNNFPLTHQKTLVTDGRQAFIMTFNLTPRYYATGRDFAVTDTDLADVAAIEATFTNDWDGLTKTASSGDDLVWSPGSADTLIDLISSATHSLEIENEEIADPRIVTALLAAQRRGVTIRFIMTYATNWKANLTTLAQAGVGVRTYASTSKILYIHAKVIIADDARAFVGSENFSAQSLNQNRELGILISRPDVITPLEQTLNDDWAGARPF